MEKDENAGGRSVRFLAESKSLARDALEILLGTEKRYNSHVQRFVKFCDERYTETIKATTEMGIKFLTEYFKTGVGYSLTNSACSVLSSIIKPVCNVPLGKLTLVYRLLKWNF